MNLRKLVIALLAELLLLIAGCVPSPCGPLPIIDLGSPHPPVEWDRLTREALERQQYHHAMQLLHSAVVEFNAAMIDKGPSTEGEKMPLIYTEALTEIALHGDKDFQRILEDLSIGQTLKLDLLAEIQRSRVDRSIRP